MAAIWAAYTLAARGLYPARADFIHHYTLGRIALLRQGQILYDQAAQDVALHQFIPSAPPVVFVPAYPPQTALFYAPIALLPYAVAALCWSIVCVSSYLLLTVFALRSAPRLASQQTTVLFVAAAFPPLWYLLQFLQTTPAPILAVLLTGIALRSGHHYAAGVAVGLLAVKPQLGLLFAVVFTLAGDWRLVVGAVLSVTLQLGLAAAWFGPAVIGDYVRVVQRLPEITPLLDAMPHHLHSLSAFFQLLLPRGLAIWPTLVADVAVVIVCLRVWRSSASLNTRYATLILGCLLVSPHSMVYDLVLLVPALIWIVDAVWEGPPRLRSRAIVLIYVLFASFFLPVAWLFRVQASVLVMVALLLTTAAVARAVPGYAGERGEPWGA